MHNRMAATLAASAAVAALVLTGCSSDESANDTNAVVATTPAGASDTSAPTATSSPIGTTDSQTPAGDVALTAIATAVASVPGSRAFAYDRDGRDRYIEVTVVDEGSVERVVVMDITGSRVTRTENEGRLDSSDLADFNAVTVELVDAIATAATSSPGVLREADLEDRRRMLFWELDIQDGARTTTINVDAKSGKIAP